MLRSVPSKIEQADLYHLWYVASFGGLFLHLILLWMVNLNTKLDAIWQINNFHSPMLHGPVSDRLTIP
ncbi:hypothetical protein DCD74_02210 [Lysobacter oculi]|uniref:Uncharacterized protein n=1 Tax=Solilutibacter oculi TaxID=2698682 RepID=A0A344J3P8_9GAMM|nr:hypothetical protein DCD74_02210 [Lysobacter oculi]